MVDIYQTEDVQRLFNNKFIVIIGDSIQRSVYKDFIRLLQDDRYLTPSQLKMRGVKSILGDELLEGGVLGNLHNGKDYREVRQYHTDIHLVRYYYVTRCYGEYMETILQDLQNPDQPSPDVIIMSSCVWDITRYGPNGMQEYKKRLQQLCHRLHEILKEDTLFIWSGALPVGREVRGGFMLSEISFMNEVLRSDVVEANYFASQVMQDQGYDMIDFHYYFRHQIQHRLLDGIHWDEVAHRRISNMLLTHIAQAWHIPLPSMYKNTLVHQQMKKIQDILNKVQPYCDDPTLTEEERRYGGPIRTPSYMMPPPNQPPQRVRNLVRPNRAPGQRQRSLSCQPLIQHSSNQQLLVQRPQGTPRSHMSPHMQVRKRRSRFSPATGGPSPKNRRSSGGGRIPNAIKEKGSGDYKRDYAKGSSRKIKGQQDLEGYEDDLFCPSEDYMSSPSPSEVDASSDQEGVDSLKSFIDTPVIPENRPQPLMPHPMNFNNNQMRSPQGTPLSGQQMALALQAGLDVFNNAQFENYNNYGMNNNGYYHGQRPQHAMNNMLRARRQQLQAPY